MPDAASLAARGPPYTAFDDFGQLIRSPYFAGRRRTAFGFISSLSCLAIARHVDVARGARPSGAFYRRSRSRAGRMPCRLKAADYAEAASILAEGLAD